MSQSVPSGYKLNPAVPQFPELGHRVGIGDREYMHVADGTAGRIWVNVGTGFFLEKGSQWPDNLLTVWWKDGETIPVWVEDCEEQKPEARLMLLSEVKPNTFANVTAHGTAEVLLHLTGRWSLVRPRGTNDVQVWCSGLLVTLV